jgi:polyphosphate kinase
MQSPEALDLRDPSLYANRELSLLAFQGRVLAQARDASLPLLERLRFLTISSSNLDEFFEIRVSGLKQQVQLGLPRTEADGMSAQDTLRRIDEAAHALVREQYEVLNDLLLPALEAEGIRLHRRAAWTVRQQRWIQSYFRSEVLPLLSPIALDPAHPFPRIQNKSLNFIVDVEGEDAFGRSTSTAIVKVPRSLPRVIALPEATGSLAHEFVLLSSIMHAHIAELFPGLEVQGAFQFRLTRNSDLWVEEEEVDDLMRALRGELSTRHFGQAVRLEVAENCPEDMTRLLLETFELDPADLYRVNGPVNLVRLSALVDLVHRPDLKYAPFEAKKPARLIDAPDLFAVLRQGDLVLHHPFDSFQPVVDLVRAAASDPNVLAIKQTLYRSGESSPIVDALIEAARAGKEVTVVIELRARFDEAANISLATRLQEAGANVAYGVVGYKCHAKLLLVVRRERRHLRRYVHLGTGNYHVGTARAYTDLSLLSCDRELGEDVQRLFLQLTGLGRVAQLEKLLQAPFTLDSSLIALIEREAWQAQKGGLGRIVAKMNALADPKVIQALYRASQAGVQVDLIVRGTCCLVPGIPGVSENIRVRSVVGRFLEHERCWWFHAGGRELVWATSADWMQRNLYRRVEVAFPIEDPGLARRVREECLETYLADDLQAWELSSDGSYVRVVPQRGAQGVSAQQTLLAGGTARADEGGPIRETRMSARTEPGPSRAGEPLAPPD